MHLPTHAETFEAAFADAMPAIAAVASMNPLAIRHPIDGRNRSTIGRHPVAACAVTIVSSREAMNRRRTAFSMRFITSTSPRFVASIVRLLVMCCFPVLGARAAGPQSAEVDLTGRWYFALDPLDRGEQLGWQKPEPTWAGDKAHTGAGWDAVDVPHDFLSDPRYGFTGVAWYRRSFEVSAHVPADAVWRLHFDQVSQRCRIWINGEPVGAHEGGYTPFEFTVTKQARPGRQNLLVVAVDNRIHARSLPGARSGGTGSAQLFPWLNYGGILGRVILTGTPPVYIVRQQIDAAPDLMHGSASYAVSVTVRNDTALAQPAEVAVTIQDGVRVKGGVTLPPQSEQVVTLRGELPREHVKLWSLDSQPLFVARTDVRSGGREHAIEDTFGIRAIAVRDGRLLLNERPIRVAGANRARGHPHFGGFDPDAAVQRDMELMKAAGLRFARLQHTPPQRNLLDWADRNGMLLILEVGVWGYPAADLGSAELRQQFEAEMRELITSAANHPSVVGWSVGNEYESWTPEGIAWTRDMVAFVKSVDPTRVVTFAAIGNALRRLHDDGAPSGAHAFDYVDLICTNIYFPPEQAGEYLDPVHAHWPTKPVLMTEFGLRADQKSEASRIAHFDQMLAVVRARPWMCGMSYWSFNDYASHYPGTGADGYRRWGLVDEFRRPRELYDHVRQTVGHGIEPP